jgi:hypothetical protein
MMNGSTAECLQAVTVVMEVSGISVELDCLVVDTVPGFDMLLGIDAINKLGGVKICSDGERVQFLKKRLIAAVSTNLAIDDKDFEAVFENGSWLVKWKWVDGPPVLQNRVTSYRVSKDVREEYDKEIKEWIRAGWLQPTDNDSDGVIPLMAVIQRNKDKVRPVLDYRELNQWVSSHTAQGDVCSSKLRSWRKMGNNLTIVDL